MKQYLISNLHAFALALLCLVSLNPFYVWGNYQLYYSLAFFLLITTGFLFYKKPLFFPWQPVYLAIFFVFSSTYFYLLGASIAGMVAFALSACYVYAIPEIDRVKGFIYFKNLTAIIMVPGILIWLTHLLFGDTTLFQIGQISDELNPSQLKVALGENYIKFPFAVALDYMLITPGYRFCGPFDEPGLTGTIAALLLAADRYNIRSPYNAILLIAGMISLSLAFYFLAVLYLIAISLRQVKAFIISILFLTFLGLVFSQVDFFSTAIIARISFDGGSFAGDNRAGGSLSDAVAIWQSSNARELIFGLDSLVHDGSSSWKQIPVQSGLLGIFLITTIIAMLNLRFSRQINHTSAVFLLVFIASIYQRPDVVKPAFIVILAGGLALSRINTARTARLSQMQILNGRPKRCEGS
jgi:hypothetical protein